MFYSRFEFPSSSKLEQFKELPTGWHYGQGGPISEETIKLANRVIALLATNGFTHTDVFPNEGGEVLVTAYHRQHYLGIVVEPGAAFTLNYEIGTGEVTYAESITFSQLSKQLTTIARGIWNISGLSILGSSTTTSGASTTWLSSDRLMGVACQSSSWIAHGVPAVA